MSTPHGHIKISRKAYRTLEGGGDPFWNEPREFSRWEAWEYMLQAAAYSDHKWIVGGHIMDLPRGHTPPLAISFLAEAWRWGNKRVRNFLQLLVEMDRIRAVSGASTGTVYLIMNYDYYQSGGTLEDTPEGTDGAGPGHARGTLGAGNKANKQVSKEREGAPDDGKVIDSTSRRAKRLPEDWQPSDKHRELAASRAVDIDNEVEKFRDWVAAEGKTSKDWEATFRNWIRRADEFRGRRPVEGNAALALDAGVWG